MPIQTAMLRPQPSMWSSAASNSEQEVTLLSTRDILPILEGSSQGTNSSCKIYMDCMLSHGYGFPLWLPELDLSLPAAYREIGVQIGDVGYITENGGFSFLFNVWQSRSNGINPPNLPESFYLDNVAKVTAKHQLFGPWNTICSGATNRSTTWQTRKVYFECYGTEGAILCTPRTTYLEELQNERALHDFIYTNGEHWYSYAVNQCGRPIRKDSLYFITGHVKTQSWGIATFDHHMPKPFNVLKFGSLSRWNGLRYRGDSCRTYVWKESRSATARSGPTDPSLSGGGIECDNQCLFVHGFKISLSNTVWASITRTATTAVRNDAAASQHTCSPASSSSRRSEARNTTPNSSCYQGSYSNKMSITMFPTKPKVFHPSDVINEILLKENPLARISIAHDKDWIALIQEKGTSYDIPFSTLFSKSVLEQVRYQINGLFVIACNGRGLSTTTFCSHPNSSEISILQDFIRYSKTGVTSVNDLGEMEGITKLPLDVPSSRPISKFWQRHPIRRKRSTEWVEPFVKMLQKWERNDFEIKNWMFSKEQIPQLAHTDDESWNIYRTWLNFVGSYSQEEIDATREYWENKLSGKFRVKRETRIPLEPVEIRHTAGPNITQYKVRDGPGFTISKYPNAVAFSIGRKYEDMDAFDDRKTESSVLLACQEVQESYTDLLPGHDLITHGLLDNTDIHSMTSNESIQMTSLIDNEKHNSKDLDSTSMRAIFNSTLHSSSEPIQPTVSKEHTHIANETNITQHISQHLDSISMRTVDNSTLRSSPESHHSFPESDSISLSSISDDVSITSYRKFRSHKEAFSASQDTRVNETPYQLYSPKWAMFSSSQETFSDRCHMHRYSKRNKSSPRILGTSWYRSTAVENGIFADIPYDSPYMVLPLWPGRTDSYSSEKHPFKVPVIPHYHRLYLLVWYRPDHDPSSVPADTWSESSSMSSSDLSMSSHLSFSRRYNWTLSLRRFRFSARVLTYDQLQGSGIRIPENGLDVYGPLEEAFSLMPKSPNNLYGGILLGQYLGKSEGFMFNADGLEQLELCRLTYERTDDEFKWAENYALTPIGRAVVEMTWVGGMAFTGSEHT
ncbi:hypothetical protein BDQ17DRAFT_1425702 [Cyathus striatus]|nr:hypothetical protein BDQ17DRAFT_1425702 [Cyathus striatus]